MIAYKLFKVRKNGTIGPLFINARQVIPVGEWMQAHCYPTKGFAIRPGWHCSHAPVAPHLSEKGRQWFEVEIKDFTELHRPERQGGTWYIANQLKVIKPLSKR
jgi:hypothetical protein